MNFLRGICPCTCSDIHCCFHMSEEVFMPWAATFKSLWNKSCISGSPKHLTGLTALWRRQDFAQVAILSRIVPRPVVPAALDTTIVSGEETDKGIALYSQVTWGDSCLDHLGAFLKCAPRDRLWLMRVFSCQNTNLPLRFLLCFSDYSITGANALYYQKWTFPYQTYALLAT